MRSRAQPPLASAGSVQSAVRRRTRTMPQIQREAAKQTDSTTTCHPGTQQNSSQRAGRGHKHQRKPRVPTSGADTTTIETAEIKATRQYKGAAPPYWSAET